MSVQLLDLCNDALTRISQPNSCTTWECPKRYMVGDIIEKNGDRWRIREFYVGRDSRAVNARVHLVGRSWVRNSFWIGYEENIQEKLVLYR